MAVRLSQQVLIVTVYRFTFSEIDNEGVIEPDTDDPQDMGEFENTEVKR